VNGVLFDSCAVSYWYGEVEQFRDALHKAFQVIRKEKLDLYISVITKQELLAYPQSLEQIEQLENFIKEHFNVLDFLEEPANAAAKYQRQHPIGRVKPKSEGRLLADIWFRDAAIAGTAIHYQMPLIVTADIEFSERLSAYGKYVGQIELLRATKIVTTEPSPQLPA
jgi:predicted nucleic acid-binding protein